MELYFATSEQLVQGYRVTYMVVIHAVCVLMPRDSEGVYLYSLGGPSPHGSPSHLGAYIPSKIKHFF